MVGSARFAVFAWPAGQYAGCTGGTRAFFFNAEKESAKEKRALNRREAALTRRAALLIVL